MSRERAVDRTMVAFIAESLTVAKNEGGVITSEPIEVESMTVDIALVTYTATVVAITDSNSRVTVMALQQELHRTGPAGTQLVTNIFLYSCAVACELDYLTKPAPEPRVWGKSRR